MGLDTRQDSRRCSTDLAHQGPALCLNTIRETEIAFNGKLHNLTLNALATNRGISFTLDKHLLCDGRDLCEKPLVYRLHMFPGQAGGKDVPFEEKLRRITSWQEAIVIFDSLMEDLSERSVESTIEMLNRFRIPRGDCAHMETSNPSLRALLESLGCKAANTPPFAFQIAWSYFVVMAKQGVIVDQWLKFKAEQSSEKMGVDGTVPNLKRRHPFQAF